jgi:Zn-dependent protease
MDAFVSFCVAVLFTVMLSAEAQAFAATFLGDRREGSKSRFHFNAVLHLDILGIICFLVGGFGWPRTVDIDPNKFKRPRLDTAIVRLAGPFANFLLANIAASLVSLMQIVGFAPLVFNMVLGVNITTAVYNLLPIPPLVAGVFLLEMIPIKFTRIRSLVSQAGPFAIIAIVLLERVSGQGIIRPYLDPLVLQMVNFIKGAGG